jgi:hypothetical protein
MGRACFAQSAQLLLIIKLDFDVIADRVRLSELDPALPPE